MKTAACSFLAALGALTPAASADVRYVWPDAVGVETGMSWNNAHRELYSALSAASSGDEIWVSAGTFKPYPLPAGNAFTLKSNVRLYGGMPVGSTTIDEQAPAIHVSVLSGDQGLPGTLSDNAPSVLLATNIAGAVVDGFTITLGNATHTGSGGHWIQGGGAYLSNANVRFYDCTFERNYAAFGGAIAATGDSSFRAENCLFDGNAASTGGGGAIFVDSAQPARAEGYLERCRFQGNWAVRGGAIEVWGHLESHSCLFVANTASDDGGAIAVRDATGGSLKLVNVTLAHNEAVSGFGGALYAYPGYIEVYNSILWDNRAGSTVASPQVQVHPVSAFPMEHTLLQDLASIPGLPLNWGQATRANLDADPRFEDPDGADGVIGTLDDDFRLARRSPCLDVGDRAFYPTGYPLYMNEDLDDGRRVARSSKELPLAPPQIDMGAYERQPVRRSH